MDREFIQIEHNQGWQALFQRMYQIAKANAGSQLLAKKPMNVIRNRYRDVLPIDSTRVVLEDPDNDYINANFVQVEEVGRKYVLCQGPLQHTTPHFWQMVWEQKTAGIIMLNKCVERGMNKCFPYWPQPTDPPLDVGKFVVENVGYEDGLSYRLSRLKLTKTEGGDSREILHFHYTRWPDFGVPQNPEVFLDYLYAVRASGVMESDKGPAVVHCSAGIGRSGTFCIVDALLAKLEKTREIASADLQSTLLSMRRQRLGLVQTPDQLRFSYIAVLQGALQDMELEPSNYEDLVGEEESDEEKEEEEEEVETEESEEEEDDTEDAEARLNRKYPHLNRAGSSSAIPVVDADDVPPPLPPRPIETLLPQLEESDDEEEDESEDETEEGSGDVTNPLVVGPPSDGASPYLTSDPPPPPPPTSAPPPTSPLPPPPSDLSSPPPTSPPPSSELASTSSPSKKIKLTPNISFLDDDDDDDILDFIVSSEAVASAGNSDFGENIASYPEETPEILENGGLDESLSDLEEEEEEDDDEEETPVATMEPPPPIPPRNHSLSPGPGGTYLHNYLKDDTGKTTDIYNSDVTYPWVKEATTSSVGDSFLSEGRGGERANPPPLPWMTNGITATTSNNNDRDEEEAEEVPPPIPSKAGRKNRLEEITEEERALVGELDLLEKLMETKQERKLEASGSSAEAKTEEKPLEAEGSKGVERRRHRDERKARLEGKVQGIKDNMRKNEHGYESDLSIPWLLVGFVVMLGYCAYYIIH